MEDSKIHSKLFKEDEQATWTSWRYRNLAQEKEEKFQPKCYASICVLEEGESKMSELKN